MSHDAPPRTVRAMLKWFKDDRGFGFMSSTEIAQDLFVHAAIIRRSRIQLRFDEVYEVSYAFGEKGPTVTSIKAVQTEYVTGTVERYYARRGYGFISCAEIGKVYVHKSVLDAANIPVLARNQHVKVRLSDAKPRPRAIAIRI
ncbi:MAG TPA: cold shock domain-containing protein [Candidatus Paceibacterota bacterium]|nr:cold shock domain-containing protein [Candidatus Paceibacterota bacterium]